MWNYARLAAIAAVIFIAGAISASLWERPNSYLRCMLKEMRGEPDSMRQIAARVCLDDFPSGAKGMNPSPSLPAQ
jgi:hypothetical protein